jgi:hypothetical protein
MTFTQGLLRFVRGGSLADLDAAVDEPAGAPTALYSAQPAPEPSQPELDEEALSVAEPGLPDLEAAVALVHAGLANRIVLAGFPSWPGLLWRAYELAKEADVLILPAVVREGGRVDIVIAREDGR